MAQPDTLEVLNGQGHLHLSWDPDKPEELEEARAEVQRLKSIGYTFFLVNDGGVADEIAAGHGALDVRKIDDPTRLPRDANYTPIGQKYPQPDPSSGRPMWPVCQWNCSDCVKTYPCGNCPDCPPLNVQPPVPALTAEEELPPNPPAIDDPEPQVKHTTREWRQWSIRQQARDKVDRAAGRRTVAVAPMRGG